MGQTRKTITDEQHRAFIARVRERSGAKGVIRFAGMYLAGALGISELDARRLVERVSMLMQRGEIITEIYRRLNPTTYRSDRHGAEGKVRMR